MGLTAAEKRVEGSLGQSYNPEVFRSSIAMAGGVLDRIRRELGRFGADGLKGLRLLDIGCGCDLEWGDQSLPALPILAGYEGMVAVGIDRWPYTGPGSEWYQHICHDLTDPQLDFREITGLNGFDVVTAINFLDEHISISSPALLTQLGNDYGEAKRALERIRKAAWRVLSPSGVWIWGVEVKRKFPVHLGSVHELVDSEVFKES